MRTVKAKATKFLIILSILALSAMVAQAVPPTPVNTPRAHPLAPNPHTSVGLFWIYTDANTGRQWTGGTYKVLRCSGASCTPTTEIATGLTNADYQDTGRTANTVYGYCVKANDGADSGCSPTVYVTTLAADSNMVQFPDATWAELMGPLPEIAQIPFAYYRDSATSQAQEINTLFPVVGPGPLLGTGATTSGSNILTGTGTKFLEQVAANNPSCLDAIQLGGTNLGAIASVDSNTQITLVSNAPSTQSGAALTTDINGLCGFFDPLNDYLVGNQIGYYDSEYARWNIYFMTGDPQYLRGAIKSSEAIFAGFMWLGRNRAWNGYSTTPNTDNMPAPRNFQFSGYVLLGLAGHKGVWDLLDNYLTAVYPQWVSNYRGGDHNFTYIREKAYMITFATWFVTAAPDTFPRSDGTTTSLNGSITVDGDLTDGRKDHWRDELNLDVPGLVTDDQTPDGRWEENNAYGDFGDGDVPYSVGGAFQPWISGLLADALGYCWRNPALSSTAHDAARKMVLRQAAMMGLRGYNTNVEADETTTRWRTGHYLLGNGSRINPLAFEYGADSAILNDAPDAIMVAEYRQLIPLMLAPMGLAYEMSGQNWYKTQGDEMANAAFAAVGENTGGTGDGKKALCDSDANYKDFGQCFRIAPRYFGYRLSSPSSIGTPPSVTMPSNMTLTGGVNQASLTASVTCTNTPCNYKWFLVEYPQVLGRQAPQALFDASTSLTTKLSGMESGVYKVGFYALDALGLEGHGTVNVTVGDGVFPPVVVMHIPFIPPIGSYVSCTTGSSFSPIHVRAYSPAGRTLTHVFSGTGPKDQSAPTITPSGTTGNHITVTMSGLSAGFWTMKDVVTDSAGASRTAYFYIVQAAACSSFPQPSNAHNTIPLVAKHPNHVLPAGSTSTRLYVVPVDPEGGANFTSSATGYFLGYNGSNWVVGELSHSWSQTAGPVSATITTNTANCTGAAPCVTGLTQAGTYTFQYTGSDQQSDTVTASINVTVSAASGPGKCNWHTNPRCN